MKLKNSLNVYIAFHINSDLDRKTSTKQIVELVEKMYGKSCQQVFVTEDNEEYQNIEQQVRESVVKMREDYTNRPNKMRKIKNLSADEQVRLVWENYHDSKHSTSGTEIIYKIQKPLLVSQETDLFFEKLQEILVELHEYYPHFTQIDEKATKGKGTE